MTAPAASTADAGRRERVPDDAHTVAVLRRTLVALAALGMLGTSFELASERHWNSWEQLIPWGALGVAAVAVALLAAVSTRSSVRAARWLAVLVALTSLVGITEHVIQNHSAGPLDVAYSTKWPTMSTTSQWWAAFTKSVGPAPTLAPGILAAVGACLILATIDHPALPRRRL